MRARRSRRVLCGFQVGLCGPRCLAALGLRLQGRFPEVRACVVADYAYETPELNLDSSDEHRARRPRRILANCLKIKMRLCGSICLPGLPGRTCKGRASIVILSQERRFAVQAAEHRIA